MGQGMWEWDGVLPPGVTEEELEAARLLIQSVRRLVDAQERSEKDQEARAVASEWMTLAEYRAMYGD